MLPTAAVYEDVPKAAFNTRSNKNAVATTGAIDERPTLMKNNRCRQSWRLELLCTITISQMINISIGTATAAINKTGNEHKRPTPNRIAPNITEPAVAIVYLTSPLSGFLASLLDKWNSFAMSSLRATYRTPIILVAGYRGTPCTGVIVSLRYALRARGSVRGSRFPGRCESNAARGDDRE
jgi:hypothetical protein